MTSKMNSILKNQSGTSLVVALIMMVVITLIALASSYTSIFEIKISGNQRGKANSFFGADACVNAVLPYAASINPASFQRIAPDTSTPQCNPFSNAAIPIPPPNPTSATGRVRHFENEFGPPRGTGASALHIGYLYYEIECTGCDTAGSAAKTVIRQDITRLVPVE